MNRDSKRNLCVLFYFSWSFLFISANAGASPIASAPINARFGVLSHFNDSIRIDPKIKLLADAPLASGDLQIIKPAIELINPKAPIVSGSDPVVFYSGGNITVNTIDYSATTAGAGLNGILTADRGGDITLSSSGSIANAGVQLVAVGATIVSSVPLPGAFIMMFSGLLMSIGFRTNYKLRQAIDFFRK